MSITIKTKTVRLEKNKRLRRRIPAELLATLPKQLEVPQAPFIPAVNGDRTLHDEQQVARVELLMMKGVRHKRQLMALLEIDDSRMVDRYIQRVHARWEMTGSLQDHARNRGEGLARLDLIESELWVRLQKQDDDRLSVVVLNTLLSVQKQRSEMLGLSPAVIARIGQSDGDGVTFTRQVAVHERLTMLASRMVTMIEDRTGGKVIDNGETQSSQAPRQD